MNAAATLLWLEHKRAAWVVYAALVAVALFAFVLLSLPNVVTGLDVLNVPVTGEEQDCLPPDCRPPGHSSMQMHRESGNGTSAFSWSFSKTWESAPTQEPQEPDVDARPPHNSATRPSSIQVPIPEELQIAFRPRQAVTAATAMGMTALMLLGFWIAHYREADRREMVMLYQSPVSGEVQLALRFLYMGGATSLALLAVLAAYWVVQTSQSAAPLAPIVEALGGRAHIHWGSLALALLTTGILPGTAFVLLYVQMQNAYDLLGGQRLVGLVLVLTALSLGTSAALWAMLDPESSSALLRIVSVESNASLDTLVNDFEPGRYRIEIPIEIIALGAGATLAMLALSGRIWREVEWS
ncbi:MAG: hypothetical protein GY733_05170 [bacterium]|nr:hypothetical protein [bacterium]